MQSKRIERFSAVPTRRRPNLLQARLPVVLFMALLVSACSNGIINPGLTRPADPLADRTWQHLTQDVNLQSEVRRHITDNPGMDPDAELNAHAFKRVILLVGASRDQQQVDDLAAFAAALEGVRRVHDETVSQRDRSQSAHADRLLTRRFNLRLLTNWHAMPEGFNRGRVHAVVDDARLFLMGAVTREEARALTELAQQQAGVTEVIVLFDQVN